MVDPLDWLEPCTTIIYDHIKIFLLDLGIKMNSKHLPVVCYFDLVGLKKYFFYALYVYILPWTSGLLAFTWELGLMYCTKHVLSSMWLCIWPFGVYSALRVLSLYFNYSGFLTWYGLFYLELGLWPAPHSDNHGCPPAVFSSAPQSACTLSQSESLPRAESQEIASQI